MSDADDDAQRARRIADRTKLAGSFCPHRVDVWGAYVTANMTAAQLRGTGSPVLTEIAGLLRPDATVMDLLRNPDFPDLYVSQMLAAIDKLHREQLQFFDSKEEQKGEPWAQG